MSVFLDSQASGGGKTVKGLTVVCAEGRIGAKVTYPSTSGAAIAMEVNGGGTKTPADFRACTFPELMQQLIVYPNDKMPARFAFDESSGTLTITFKFN